MKGVEDIILNEIHNPYIMGKIMDSGILALASGLIRALIGAGASVITIMIQNYYQRQSIG